jgi:hypothetical protein
MRMAGRGNVEVRRSRATADDLDTIMHQFDDSADRERMNGTSAVNQAIRRLTDALDSLDVAMERRLEDDRKRSTLVDQVHAFSTDRARLATELDASQARSRTLETANREVVHRLDVAMDTIRAVIAAHQPPLL